ncbi:hypothetical protein [Nocardia sp. NRRL S-836]|uniref:hypothetical protein n=1 Tax=Nocardia sp. NRRL S-836 TaxID=1519492 RepID=UPI0006ADD363|nr:hypothetical protein [Nocardia sp. NRRL S-836]
MSARLGDDVAVTALSGQVSVIGASTAAMLAGPETDAEKTQPLRPLTTTALLRHAVLLRLVQWRRPSVLVTLLLAAILIVLVTLLLRLHDTIGSTAAVPPAPQTVTVTATPAPPMRDRMPAAAQLDAAVIAPREMTQAELAALPRAAVGVALVGAPADPAPGADPGTVVLHPTVDTPVYAEPGGCAFAVLPPRQVLTPTWTPVLDRRAGWALVMLPSQPHPTGAAAVGWIHLRPQVELAHGDRRVEIDTATGRVTVLAELGRGSAAASTLTGTPASVAAAAHTGRRSFVATGGQADALPWLLRVLWPFGLDADRLCTGLIGGITVPGLPAASPLGQLDATGCVPAPPGVRDALREVPAGTAVLLR